MSLSERIAQANALGRENLNAKGVTTDGTETTYQIMSKIADVTGGNSVEYSSITYNDDGTVTLTQTNGAIRTMTCEYEDGKLVGLKYGNEVIPLAYEDDVLVGIGGMEVDVSNAPATSGGADTRLKDFIEGTSTEFTDDTITTAKSNAFYYSTLTKISLPNCESVGSNCFSGCSKLVDINLPKCESFGQGAFSNTNFTEIELPNAKTLGSSCFSSNRKLQKVTLGSATSLGNQCFYYCSALTTLIISTNQVATLGSTNPFYETPIQSKKGYIYVPDDLVEDYKVATTWSTYANQIKGLSELEVANNE